MGWTKSPRSLAKGVRIEVGDMIPSLEYAERLKRVPPAWEKAFEVNASSDDAVRASCVEFVLAGLYSMDMISAVRNTDNRPTKSNRWPATVSHFPDAASGSLDD